MQPSMVGVVKAYMDPDPIYSSLGFTGYRAVVEHEGIMGPTSYYYHPSTLELVPAEAETEVGD